MMVGKKLILLSVICFCFGFMLNQTGIARAAEVKIGVINGQKVLWTCTAGAKVKAKLDTKLEKYRKEFQAEEQELAKLQNDIQKKSSVWSAQKKQEMVLKYNNKRRDLQAKQEDARDDINQVKQNELQPVVAQIRKGLEKYGKEHGFTAILDSTSAAVPYFKHSIDVTDDLIKSLNKEMAK